MCLFIFETITFVTVNAATAMPLRRVVFETLFFTHQAHPYWHGRRFDRSSTRHFLNGSIRFVRGVGGGGGATRTDHFLIGVRKKEADSHVRPNVSTNFIATRFGSADDDHRCVVGIIIRPFGDTENKTDSTDDNASQGNRRTVFPTRIVDGIVFFSGKFLYPPLTHPGRPF